MLDMNSLSYNYGGDPELVVELAQVFLQEYPRYLAALDDAMSAGNGKEIRSVAHRLRGSLGIFGAQSAMEAAARLENLTVNNQLIVASDAAVALKTELSLVAGEIRALLVGAAN